MQAKSLGFSGETLAAHFLKSKGYEILANNFTIRGGEIDIIAKDKGIFVFVEVKTRTSDTFGRGEESVDKKKRLRIKRAIERYLNSKTAECDPDYRVDLMEIELDQTTNKLKNINHFEDIEL